MSATFSAPVRPSFDFVVYDDFAPLMQRLEALERQIVDLKNNQTEYVDTKEALRITGLKHGQSLKAARERPGSLVIVKFEGINNQIPRYLRSSLLAYNEANVRKPRRNGIAYS